MHLTPTLRTRANIGKESSSSYAQLAAPGYKSILTFYLLFNPTACKDRVKLQQQHMYLTYQQFYYYLLISVNQVIKPHNMHLSHWEVKANTSFISPQSLILCTSKNKWQPNFCVPEVIRRTTQDGGRQDYTQQNFWELFLFLHCLFPDPINNNITSCWPGMLLKHRGQTCLSTDAKKHCYQMLTCPRDRRTGPGPPLYLALLPWTLLSMTPQPHRVFCLFFCLIN